MTLPEKILKFCPKCGSSQFKWEGEKSFKCDSCEFHFFINTAAAVAGVIENEKGEILLTIRGVEPKRGFFDLPGGFVDPMESVELAMRREIKEELNLDVVDLDYLVSFPNEYVFSGYSVYTTDLGFVCKVKNFKKIDVRDDVSGFQFVNPKELDFDKVSSNSIKRIIKTFLKQREAK